MSSYAHQDSEGVQVKVPLTNSQFMEDDSHIRESHKMTFLGKIKNSWLPEVLAALTSTLTFGALIVILRVYNDQRLPNWSYGVTLNVVVAVLTIFISLGMSVPLSNGLGQLKWVRLYKQRKAIYLDSIDTFDAASRGPWGSFLLIVMSRQGPLSILGAVTILLGLLVGVSTQLIIRYPERAIDDDLAASMRMSAGYYNYDSGTNGVGTASASLAIMQSYYNGVFSSNATDLISPLGTVCPSGNCTWPVTETFAVCSRCTNLTSSLTYTPPKDKGYGGGFWAIPGQPINIKDQPDMTRGTQTLYVFANETTRIFDFLNMTMLGAHYVDFGEVVSPYAFNCGLSFCKQTVETKTVSGVTTQNVTKVTYNDTLTSQMGPRAPLNLNAVNITFDNTVPSMGIDTAVLYSWSKFMPKSTKPPGTVSYHTSEGLQYLGDDIPFLRAVAGAAKRGGYNFYNPDFKTIETGADIPALFERIASSMTTSLRTEEGSIPIKGQGKVNMRYVNVRWEWLILPGVAIVFTWIFLLGVIISNTRSKATKWKSSSLALLAVGSRVSRGIAGSRDADSLVETAMGMRVKMIRDPNSIEREYLSSS